MPTGFWAACSLPRPGCCGGPARHGIRVAEQYQPHLGGAYWYDQYRVNDFALGSQTLTTLVEPSFLMLGNLYRPYTANTFMGRLTYIW